jgi:hypothetical protein
LSDSRRIYNGKYAPSPRGISADVIWGEKNKKGKRKRGKNVKEKGRKGKGKRNKGKEKKRKGKENE